METLFWKTVREAGELETGYDTGGVTATERQKKAFWSEDNEETHTR